MKETEIRDGDQENRNIQYNSIIFINTHFLLKMIMT